MTFIAEISLDSVQTFSAIAGTFRHLWVVFIVACDQAAAQLLSIRFNGDSGTNYQAQSHGAFQGSIIAAQLTGQTSGRVGSLSGTGDPAGTFTAGRFFIPYYASTVNDKVALTQSYYNDGSAGPLVRIDDAQWATANAAITSITFVPGAGSFIAGSKASLYGVT